MIHKRIVTSNAPVTTIDVQGTSHHFFHSEKLGKCRAILIADDENLAPVASQAPTPDDDEFVPDNPDEPLDEPFHGNDDYEDYPTDEKEADSSWAGDDYGPNWNQCSRCGDWVYGYNLCDRCWED